MPLRLFHPNTIDSVQNSDRITPNGGGGLTRRCDIEIWRNTGRYRHSVLCDARRAYKQSSWHNISDVAERQWSQWLRRHCEINRRWPSCVTNSMPCRLVCLDDCRLIYSFRFFSNRNLSGKPTDRPSSLLFAYRLAFCLNPLKPTVAIWVQL